VRNLPIRVTSQEAHSSGIPPKGSSSSSKPIEGASNSGIPPQGTGNSRKPTEGGALKQAASKIGRLYLKRPSHLEVPGESPRVRTRQGINEGRDTPIVGNLHMKVTSWGSSCSGTPLHGASSYSKPMEGASCSGIPLQGASRYSKPLEGASNSGIPL
jgi:hypothetical protein